MNDSLERGWQYYHLRRYADAARHAVEHMRRHVDCADARRLLAHAQQQLGQHDDAIATARDAVAKGPDSYLSHQALCIVCYNAGRHEDALAAIQEARRLQPDAARNWELLASCLGVLGSLDPALLAIDKSIELDATDPEAFHTKARILQAIGQPAAAIAALDVGLRLAPRSAWMLRMRADLKYRQGDVRAARDCHLLAVQARPDQVAWRRDALNAARLSTLPGRVLHRVAHLAGIPDGAQLAIGTAKLLAVLAVGSCFAVLQLEGRGPHPEQFVYAWIGVMPCVLHTNDLLVVRNPTARLLLAEQGHDRKGAMLAAALALLCADVAWAITGWRNDVAAWIARACCAATVVLWLRSGSRIRRRRRMAMQPHR